jgi:hypothetical protein
MLWIDVPTDLALGYHPSPIKVPSPKRLTLQDPRVVKNYIKILRERLVQCELLHRLHNLESDISGTISPAQIRQYDSLDTLRIEAAKYAQNHCRKLCMGAVPFSPALSLAGKKIRAWKLVIRKKAGGFVHTKFLNRKLKAAGIDDISLLSIDDARENLRDAWQQYRCLKKRARSDRATWIEDLAAARAAEGNTSLASELKQLLLREQQRRDARIIKAASADVQRLALTMIKIKQGEEWVEITEKDAMEKALCHELHQRFNQAQHTPFCSPMLLAEVGPLGVTGASENILEGNYTPPLGCDPWVNALLPHMKYAIPPIDFPLMQSLPQYKAGWKRVRERTSSGISGLTIPQMKVHATDELLAEVDSIFARLPYRWGFSPDRWCKGIDVMLEKRKECIILTNYEPSYYTRPILIKTTNCLAGRCLPWQNNTMQSPSSNLAAESFYQQWINLSTRR